MHQHWFCDCDCLTIKHAGAKCSRTPHSVATLAQEPICMTRHPTRGTTPCHGLTDLAIAAIAVFILAVRMAMDSPGDPWAVHTDSTGSDNQSRSPSPHSAASSDPWAIASNSSAEESGADADIVQVATPGKKRGRGRPPKRCHVSGQFQTHMPQYEKQRPLSDQHLAELSSFLRPLGSGIFTQWPHQVILGPLQATHLQRSQVQTQT